jgi:hypothetical protein
MNDGIGQGAISLNNKIIICIYISTYVNIPAHIHIHLKKKMRQSHEQGSEEEWITDEENELLEEVNIRFTK